MNGIDKLISEPMSFLAEYVVPVVDASQMDFKLVDVKEFEFFQIGDRKVVSLCTVKSGIKAKAYWLLWKTREYTVLNVSSETALVLHVAETGRRFRVSARARRDP